MRSRARVAKIGDPTRCDSCTHTRCGAALRASLPTQTRVKRSLSVVNFKRRIASFAWCVSSSAFAQRTRPSCIQHCLLLNAPTFAGYPSAAFYAAELSPATHNTSRHARLRPFHVAYGQSQRSMAGPPMRGLINHGSRSKHKFLPIALPLPLPWLAHLCSLKFCRKLCLRHYPVLCISAR